MAGVLNRRAFGLAAGAGLVVPPLVRAAPTDSPFALGVASGSPSPDGFVLWTRLVREPLAADGRGGMAGPVEIAWAVAEDEAMTRIAARGDFIAEERTAHAAHVEVAGLEPDRPYFYRFTALGAQSPLGRARTAPAPGGAIERLRIALACCAHYETGWFSAYRHMAAEAPDLTVFLGDYIYEYSYGPQRAGLVRRHDRQGEIRDLAGYRNRYALHRLDPDLQALHAAAPCLATWDDHEVQNDYGGDHSQIGTVPAEAFALRRMAAYQAFYEHMPLRAFARPTASGAMRLYDRLSFGDLARISLLDVRQHRGVQACPRGGNRRGYVAAASCEAFEDPARSMLGREQEAWLYDGFRTAEGRWNLVAGGLMVSPYVQKTAQSEDGYYTDGWSAFGANRTRMLEALRDSRMANPVFFGGDLHAFVAGDLAAEPGGRALGAEFIATAVTSDLMPDSFGETLDRNSHVRFVDNTRHGYVLAELTPARMDVALRAIGDRTDPATVVSTLRRFVVEDGRPGAQAG